MLISEETKRDLENIVETLDQRLYELYDQPESEECRLLRDIRDQTNRGLGRT